MAPKKIGLVASTPAVTNHPSTFHTNVDSSGPSSIEESSVFRIRTGSMSDDLSAKSKFVPQKLTTLELMCKAIEDVGVPRKGASYIAILRWIESNKENIVIGRLRPLLRKTILKAIETGLLKRPAISKNSTGVQGYFMLNRDSLKNKDKLKKKVLSKKKNDVKETNASESLSDTELTKKPRKRNAEKLNKSASEVVGPKKVASNNVLKIFGKKKVPLKGEKEKTTKKRKESPESGPSTAAVPVPKTKAATASKTKKDAKILKSVPNVKGSNTQKAKIATASDQKETRVLAASSKAKEAVVYKTKTKAAATSKPKAQPKTAGNIQELQEAEPVPKTKNRNARMKQIVEMDNHEPEATVEKKVAEKSRKKAASKPMQKATDKEPITKKLDSSNMIRNTRKDLSFSELSMNPVIRNALRSYTSDSEIEEIKKGRATKKKNASVKTKTFMKESEAGPSRLKEHTTNKKNRKDLSDTELALKPANRKSLKSYASDTEIEFQKEKAKNKKIKTTTVKTFTFVKESEAGSSKAKVIKKKKDKTA